LASGPLSAKFSPWLNL